MTEDSTQTNQSDFSRMNAGKLTAFCKTCNRITAQQYLGLEFSSRKVASRCLECRNTNFQDEDPERWRGRNRKEAKTPLQEIQDEKSKIFGQQPGASSDSEGDPL